MHAKFKVREGVAWRWNTHTIRGKHSSTCQRLTISYLSDTSNIGWLALSNIIDGDNRTGVTCVRGQHGEAGWQVKHTVNKQTSKQQVNIQVNKLVEQVNKQVNVVKQANKQVNNRACKQTRALQQHIHVPHSTLQNVWSLMWETVPRRQIQTGATLAALLSLLMFRGHLTCFSKYFHLSLTVRTVPVLVRYWSRVILFMP